MTPRPTHTMELLASWAVRHRGATLPLPADPYPSVKLVQVKGSGEHQQARGYELMACRAPPASHQPAITPAHSVRMSSRPCATSRR
jgi:hypothetical protein